MEIRLWRLPNGDIISGNEPNRGTELTIKEKEAYLNNINAEPSEEELLKGESTD